MALMSVGFTLKVQGVPSAKSCADDSRRGGQAAT